MCKITIMQSHNFLELSIKGFCAHVQHINVSGRNLFAFYPKESSTYNLPLFYTWPNFNKTFRNSFINLIGPEFPHPFTLWKKKIKLLLILENHEMFLPALFERKVTLPIHYFLMELTSCLLYFPSSSKILGLSH